MINIRDLIVNQGFAKAILGSGGGSGGSAKVTSGQFTGTGVPFVLEHGLGVIPDAFYVICMSGFTSTVSKNRIHQAFGVSAALYKASGFYGQKGAYYASGKSTLTFFSGETIDYTTQTGSYCLNNANKDTITIGTTSGGLGEIHNGWTYKWIAIGGLTE